MLLTKSRSNSIILALSFIGCFVALVLFYEHLRPAADIGCSAIGGNCQATVESDYGHLGKIPTSVFGLGMYITIAAICFRRKKLIAGAVLSGQIAEDAYSDESEAGEPVNGEIESYPLTIQSERYNKQILIMDAALWIITASAFCISIWLQKIAIYELRSFCPWCMSSALLVTIIFVLTSKDLFIGERKLVGEQRLLAGTIAFMSMMGLLMVGPDVIQQITQIIKVNNDINQVGPIKPPPNGGSLPEIITKDVNITGPKAAPYTIVEFADYQCPHCMKASLMISEELKKNPTKYRLAFRNDPLPMHPWARQAAAAAESAGLQGKFWEMHDYLFAHQADMEKKTFTEEMFGKFAEAVGLNVEKFHSDMTSEKISNKIMNDAKVAPLFQVTMTPTFYIVNSKHRIYKMTGLELLKAAFANSSDKAWDN